MRTWDEETERFMQGWTEREVRDAIGVGTTPACTAQDIEGYAPKGPHKWFAEAIAEIAAIVAMQRLSETWQVRPPYTDWADYAPAIQQHAEERRLTAKLPPGTTLAAWFSEHEPLLQQEPYMRERYAIVAAVLLPIFEQQPDCWEATNWLNDDMSCGTFSEYLEDWHAQAPATCRPFVRRIAQEFGVEIDEGVIGEQ